jgi:hypothetical protein
MFTSLEAIRLGDLSANFLKAVQDCKIVRVGSQYICRVVALPLTFEWLENIRWKLLNGSTMDDRMRHIGLRGRYLSALAGIDQERIHKLSVTVMLEGRYETLATQWEIAERVPSHP